MIESTEQGLSVERTLELTAPVDRVWRALTDPEELARWFPDRVDQAEEIPCLIAFSMRGCRVKLGSLISINSGAISMLTLRRFVRRACSMVR